MYLCGAGLIPGDYSIPERGGIFQEACSKQRSTIEQLQLREVTALTRPTLASVAGSSQWC